MNERKNASAPEPAAPAIPPADADPATRHRAWLAVDVAIAAGTPIG